MRNNLPRTSAIIVICVLLCLVFLGCGKQQMTQKEIDETIKEGNELLKDVATKIKPLYDEYVCLLEQGKNKNDPQLIAIAQEISMISPMCTSGGISPEVKMKYTKEFIEKYGGEK